MFCQQVYANTLTLSEVLSQTLSSNPVIAQYKHKLMASESSLEEAEWGWFPSLSSSWQRDNSGTSTTNLTIIQPVWNGGRITGAVKSAQARLGITQAEGEERVLAILTEVSGIYYDIKKQQALYKIAKDNEAQYKKLYEIISRRSKSSVSPRIDLTLSSSRLEVARIEIQRIKQQKQSLFDRLNELSGKDYDSHTFLTPSKQINDSQAGLLRHGYQTSPTRKRLSFRLDLANHAVELKKAERFPEVSLSYQKRFGDIGVGQPSDEFRLSLNFDTGSGLSKFASYKADLFERDSVQQEIRAYRMEYHRTLRDKWNAVDNLERILPSLKTASDAAMAVLESYIRQFQAGRKSWLDVLNTQRERNQALVSYIQTKIDIQKLKVDLLLYAGRLQASPSTDISSPKE